MILVKPSLISASTRCRLRRNRSQGSLRGAAVAIIYTILSDVGAVLAGMVGRDLLLHSGQNVDATVGAGGQTVLPQMVDLLLTPLLVAVFISIVLAAIMSTVDSMLVLASSAVVRDFSSSSSSAPRAH
jgi:sodium/proline symporter